MNMITIRRPLFTKTYAIHWSLPNGWNLKRLYTFYATLMYDFPRFYQLHSQTSIIMHTILKDHDFSTTTEVIRDTRSPKMECYCSNFRFQGSSIVGKVNIWPPCLEGVLIMDIFMRHYAYMINIIWIYLLYSQNKFSIL